MLDHFGIDPFVNIHGQAPALVISPGIPVGPVDEVTVREDLQAQAAKTQIAASAYFMSQPLLQNNTPDQPLQFLLVEVPEAAVTDVLDIIRMHDRRWQAREAKRRSEEKEAAERAEFERLKRKFKDG